MCKIFMIQKKKITRSDISELINRIVPLRGPNVHGWGAFNDKGRTYKNIKKFNKKVAAVKLKDFAGSKFLVIHIRNATSGGIKLESTHPFRMNSKLFVHNGVIGSYYNYRGYFADTKSTSVRENREVDSLRMFKQIIKYSNGNVIDGIKKVVADITGTWSCFIYDLKVKRLFYFKNAKTKMTFGYLPESGIFLASTSRAFVKNMFSKTYKGFFRSNKDRVVKDPSANVIYEITDNSVIDELDYLDENIGFNDEGL